MTTKFKMYTCPIGPEQKTFILNDVTVKDYENLKYDLKKVLTINDYLSLKLNLTTGDVFASHKLEYYNQSNFVTAILNLFKPKEEQKNEKIKKLKKSLIDNNINVEEKEPDHLTLSFNIFLDKFYLFDIYITDKNEFQIEFYCNGDFEMTYNTVEIDENEDQPYFLMFNEYDENPLTIDQIVNVFKELQKLVKQSEKIENNLPF